MKRILLYLGTSMAILCIVVTACKKSTTTVSSDTSHLNALFSGLKTSPQTLSVTAGRDTIVYGSGGTMLHFYTNSFKNASGAVITSGTISIQLVEMYKPGDMALNRATTTLTTAC